MSTFPTLAPVSDLGPISLGILSSSQPPLSRFKTSPTRKFIERKATTAMVAPCSPLTCSDFVKDGCLLTFLAEKSVEFASRFPGISPEIILLELVLFLVHGREESEGILVYLAAAEEREPDVWLRDDYRIAWLTVLYCANGRPTAWDWAFNQVIGGHPSKVIPALVARAARHVAMELPPKKAAASTRSKNPSLKEKTA